MISPELKALMVDAGGRYRANIFKEFNYDEHKKYPPIYTMHEQDKGDLISAHRIYMESVDEYAAAMELVGSWAHWKRLMKIKCFMEGPDKRTGAKWEGLLKWREQKRLQEHSRALYYLELAAKSGNVAAARTLLEETKPDGRGRPQKKIIEDTEREIKKDKMIQDSLNVIKFGGPSKPKGPDGRYIQKETGASKRDN